MSDGANIEEELRNHYGREVIGEIRKFRWRYTTLSGDYEDFMSLREASGNHNDDWEQQIADRGYLFEVERRLHHYLSGFYTFMEVIGTLRDGVAGNVSSKIGKEKGGFGQRDSTKAIFGLRHYVQHENVIPLQTRISKIDGRKEVIIIVDDLHRHRGYKNGFDSHYGHIDSPYINPFELIGENWPDLNSLHNTILNIIYSDAKTEMEEYAKLTEDLRDVMKGIKQKW